MAFKFVVLSCLVAMACANVVPLLNSQAQYAYSYGVSDPYTGDVKSQQEVRSGNSVRGSYSVLDADGLRRTVDYAADPHTGFNAVVNREPSLVAAAPIVAASAPLLNHGVLSAPLLARAGLPVSTGTLISQAHGPIASVHGSSLLGLPTLL